MPECYFSKIPPYNSFRYYYIFLTCYLVGVNKAWLAKRWQRLLLLTNITYCRQFNFSTLSYIHTTSKTDFGVLSNRGLDSDSRQKLHCIWKQHHSAQTSLKLHFRRIPFAMATGYISWLSQTFFDVCFDEDCFFILS